ncbi:MAG: hypothetical protein AAI946_00920 [Candidatus Hodgkinia cicadicola]
MKILVTTKVVSEPDAIPSVNAGQLQITSAKRVIDHSDEASLQAAVDIKRGVRAAKITAVCVGTLADKSAFKRVLAMGADDAVLIRRTDGIADALNTAALIRRLVTLEGYELVLLSNSSSDNGSGQVAPALASLLNWAHLSNVTRLAHIGRTLRAACLLDKGYALFEISLPCIIACNARIAKPRFVGLSELVGAKSKRLRLKTATKLNTRWQPKLTAVDYTPAVVTRAGNTIAGMANALELMLTCLKWAC